jgi:hypothetical protein
MVTNFLRPAPHRRTFRRSRLTCLAALLLAACAAPKPPLYHQEEFSQTETYSRNFGYPEAATCEAARRALLSQGYIISKAEANVIDGAKSFQPEQDKHMEISFHIVCAANAKGSNSSAAFVSAVQDQYVVKKTNNSASVGLSVLGTLSMPVGSSDDALVKVASETIRSAEFYGRFFGAVERFLTNDEKAPAAGNGEKTTAP